MYGVRSNRNLLRACSRLNWCCSLTSCLCCSALACVRPARSSVHCFCCPTSCEYAHAVSHECRYGCCALRRSTIADVYGSRCARKTVLGDAVATYHRVITVTSSVHGADNHINTKSSTRSSSHARHALAGVQVQVLCCCTREAAVDGGYDDPYLKQCSTMWRRQQRLLQVPWHSLKQCSQLFLRRQHVLLALCGCEIAYTAHIQHVISEISTRHFVVVCFFQVFINCLLTLMLSQ